MADARFFSVAGPFTLGHLAEISGAVLEDESASKQLVFDVAPLSTAQKDQISFWDNKQYVDEFTASQAGACIVRTDVKPVSDQMVLLKTPDPYTAYAQIAQAFYPETAQIAEISKSATIDPLASIGKGCNIAPGAVIGAEVKIGDNTQIGANAVIADGVEIGADCLVGPNVTVQKSIIGNRVILHPGVRIGQDGFGFALSEKGHAKVPQLGRVVIEDDVEIGANSTIDRGAGPDTVIGQGTKIDNLVQIAHNVKIGRNCIIVSQVGISGSTKIGDFVIMGGQAGLTGHLTIGDGAQIAAQGGVMRDIEPGQKVGGTPAVPMRQWLKSAALMEKLLKSDKKELMMDTDAPMTQVEDLDVNQIMEMIPHRYPFLLIDRVTNIVLETSAIGIKNVTINEPFFQGHFPSQPIMPGVLIVEAMAQTAGVLVIASMDKRNDGRLVYFMTIDNARFRKPVVPGDTLNIHVTKVQNRGTVWKFKGEAKVDGKVVAEATYAAMIVDQ